MIIEPASVGTLLGEAALGRGVAIALTAAATRFKKGKPNRQELANLRRQTEEKIEESLNAHLALVSSWSELHKPVDLPAPLDVEASTVPLDMTDMPRRYQIAGGSRRALAEEDLLESRLDLLLIGDPGAGKTTTVRRLCRWLLTGAPRSADDTSSYPMLIECRSQDWEKKSLVDVLCDATGFPETDGDRFAGVVGFLNETGAFILIGGLDEVTYRPGTQNRRKRLERDIQTLGHHLRRARLLVSCRSGDAPEFEAFRTVELCPLTDAQIQEVVRARLGEDSAAFMERLAGSPIQDVARRPLLLAQIISLYELRGGQMPNRPAVLYKKLVKLLLEEWDEKREIVRPSKYAAFGPEEKMEFLSELSYRLTINGSIRFSTDELVDIYEATCERWGLPRKEAKRVAREIETHNGLVVRSGDMYEFSHLSLQEYLCAEYMARLSDLKRLAGYIDRYPEPVAVAVSVASEPTGWLADVVMRRSAFQQKRTVRAFVHRLGREQPGFVTNPDLGHAILKLMFNIDDKDMPAFEGLAGMPAVRDSLAIVVPQYQHRRARNGVSLKYDGPPLEGRSYTPVPGRISKPLWDLMLPGTDPKIPSR